MIIYFYVIQKYNENLRRVYEVNEYLRTFKIKS